jgi:hypothetical protein
VSCLHQLVRRAQDQRRTGRRKNEDRVVVLGPNRDERADQVGQRGDGDSVQSGRVDRSYSDCGKVAVFVGFALTWAGEDR